MTILHTITDLLWFHAACQAILAASVGLLFAAVVACIWEGVRK